MAAPVEYLRKAEIVAKLKYLKDSLDYKGSRDVRNLEVGRALLTEARRITSLPADQRPQAAPIIIAGLNTANQRPPEGYTVVRRVGECHVCLIWRLITLKTHGLQREQHW